MLMPTISRRRTTAPTTSLYFSKQTTNLSPTPEVLAPVALNGVPKAPPPKMPILDTITSTAGTSTATQPNKKQLLKQDQRQIQETKTSFTPATQSISQSRSPPSTVRQGQRRQSPVAVTSRMPRPTSSHRSPPGPPTFFEDVGG